MSAAVNDRPLDVIVPAPHLPLTGELHPLRQEFARWLATGNLITITLAVTVCATLYFWPRPAPAGYVDMDTVDPRIMSPPPIDPGVGPGSEQLIVTPDVGKANYEPTDDKELSRGVEPVDNTGGGGSEVGGPIDGSSIGGIGGSVIQIDPPAPKPSEVYTPFDTEPVLISIDPPAYPEMVKDAGIDGTVLVRVFIGLNGRVKDAYVVDGTPALREAALACARTASFKPARQGTHPVEVWVVIPITFQLRERY